MLYYTDDYKINKEAIYASYKKKKTYIQRLKYINLQ